MFSVIKRYLPYIFWSIGNTQISCVCACVCVYILHRTTINLTRITTKQKQKQISVSVWQNDTHLKMHRFNKLQNDTQKVYSEEKIKRKFPTMYGEWRKSVKSNARKKNTLREWCHSLEVYKCTWKNFNC